MPRHNVQIAMGQGSLATKIDYYLSSIGFGFNPGQMRRARLREIIVLETATDDQLRDMGLDRKDILPHVFRDLLN